MVHTYKHGIQAFCSVNGVDLEQGDICWYSVEFALLSNLNDVSVGGIITGA